MPATYVCPNCAKKFNRPISSCSGCGYPNHKRTETDSVPAASTQPKYQFHIYNLLFCMTVTAIMIAVLRSKENSALGTALTIGAILFPIVEFIYYFAKNLVSKKPNAIDEYENRFFRDQ